MRGGAVGLVGALSNTVGGFVLILVATHTLGPAGSGQFFAAIALFTVVINTAKLGADTSLVRFVAHLVARGREAEIWRLLRIALPPALVGSCLAAVVLGLGARSVASLLYADVPLSAGAASVRALAWFVPVATITLVLLAATRGFGSVTAFVFVEQVFKPLSRPVLLAGVFVFGGGPLAALGAWLAPVGIGIVLAAAALRAQLGSNRAAAPSGGQTITAQEFWGFATPRAFSGFLEILAPWVAVLLLSSISGSVDAAIFTSVARIVVAGTIVMVAVRLSLAPHLSAAFSVGDIGRVRDLHRHSTTWMILVSWPFFLIVAAFPETVLVIFGEKFSQGSWALVVVAAANMLNVAVGNVQTMVLMGGRSSWNLLGNGLAVSTQIGLGLLLIGRWGVTGAGVAYGAGILVNNITATLQVRYGLRIQVWSSSSSAACALTSATFGVLAVGCRLLVTDTLAGLIGTGIIASAVCVGVVARWPALFCVREGQQILRGLERGSAQGAGG